MKQIITTIFLLVSFSSCIRTKNDSGVTMGVIDKGDTLSTFYYNGSGKYEFYDSAGADSLFLKSENLKMIPGQFKFGIKDKTGTPDRFLIFLKTSKSKIEFPENKFFAEELLTNPNYGLELHEDYIDSTENPVKKYVTHLVKNNVTGDTILFQEINYVIIRNQMLTTYIVYTNYDTREQMRLEMENVYIRLNESVKDRIDRE